MKIIFILCVPLLLISCVAQNKLSAVNNFKLEKYLGKWYEIARLPNKFEKNLTHVTAEYSLNSDGSVGVLNSGYDVLKNKRSSASGKAKFKADTTTGLLKVSFFWPFSASYKIVLLDANYQYAVVVSSGYNYLWILSRTPQMEKPVLDKLITQIDQWEFDTDKLIRVDQKP